jgi:hypothetical protein
MFVALPSYAIAQILSVLQSAAAIRAAYLQATVAQGETSRTVSRDVYPEAFGPTFSFSSRSLAPARNTVG